MRTIHYFLDAYSDESYQRELDALHNSRGDQDADEWAKEIYVAFRDDKTNARVSVLNQQRRNCLRLVYEMVNAWVASPAPEAFEDDVVQVLELWRLKRILSVCIPMDRAHALYCLQLPTSTLCGMHWYCKLHLQESPASAVEGDQKLLAEALVGYDGSATMNKRLYKVLHTPSFGLLQDPSFARWARPTVAVFTSACSEGTAKRDVAEDAVDAAEATEVKSSAAIVPRKRLKITPNLDPTGERIHSIVHGYVSAFYGPSYQACLGRLYQDRGDQDPEKWAEELYLLFRDEPTNTRALALNQDRRTCLQLLYDLVNEWAQYDYSSDFEHAIRQIFKVRRLERILGVGLVMDRAQSLFKMGLPCGEDDMWCVGMHWYSDLHLTSPDSVMREEDKLAWNMLLQGYEGRGTMNRRLYRLLHSEVLGLRKNAHLSKWSEPYHATFIYQQKRPF